MIAAGAIASHQKSETISPRKSTAHLEHVFVAGRHRIRGGLT